MKKVAIGCGVITVILLLAIIGGGYWLFRSARTYIASYAELAQVAELNEQIENRSPFQPPANQRLTEVQMQQFVQVQRTMLDHLGQRVRELEGKYEHLSADMREQGREANVREILGAWSDVVSLIVSAKEAQVQALNDARLSLAEYHWIRQQVLLTLGYGIFGLNVEAIAEDPALLLESLQAPDELDQEALQHNRALLQQYEDSYEEWLPLSFFGL